MSRTLFIGDSHTMGYIGHEQLPSFEIWQNNNYAEIYSEQTGKPAVVMASAGCDNKEYVNFLAHAFKKYDDIDEVFIQSTYWGRFALAINPDLDEKAIFPLDFFIEQNESSPGIDRFSIGMVQQEKYMVAYAKPSADDYKTLPYNRKTDPNNRPLLQRTPYLYIQMYHYSQTHLEQQDYMRSILLCDTLCRNNNAKLHVWNINNRCFIPQESKDYYTNLHSTKIANTTAIDYLKTIGLSVEDDKVDSEHYSYNVHKLIAEHYIPYLKTL